MHEYEASVLMALRSKKEMGVDQLCSATSLGRDAVLWAIENLAKNNYVQIVRENVESYNLTDEGREYSKRGLPEQALLKRVGSGGVDIKNLSPVERNIGLPWAKSKGFIKIENGKVSATPLGKEIAGKKWDEQIVLENVDLGRKLEIKKHHGEVAELMKRGLVLMKKTNPIKGVKITHSGDTANISVDSSEIENVTKKVIVNRGWVGKKFKKYDAKVKVDPAVGARSHPLRDTINQIKRAYLSMGFREVSGPIVEPSFWVQDSLMIPQDHPARDMQDTFYLENPQSIDISDNKLLKRVAKEHEKAWHGEWKDEIAEKAMLRSHSTSVTARFLYSLNNVEDYELPIKIFSVGRVFRNENVDYRHLADFYQADGMIIGENLTLANLFDTLTRLYKMLGLKTRFIPTYFPFVEPGVEIQAFYEERGEWLEMGGAGVLRHEIIRAAGKKFDVLAWGPGVERIVLMRDPSIKSVTELYNNGIGWIRKRS